MKLQPLDVLGGRYRGGGPPVARRACRPHHSEVPFYDQGKTVDIRGVVPKWVFSNPHPFLYVDVTDGQGAKVEWVLEFVGPVRLMKVGWSAKTFVPGETIGASGHPSRAAGTYGMSSQKVARADDAVIPGSGRGGSNAPGES